MAAGKPQSSGIVSVRANNAFIGSPGTLLYHNLITPDDAFDSLKFNVRVGYTGEQSDRLGELIDEHVIEPLWSKFVDAAAEAEKAVPRGGWVKPEGAQWVADHLKEPLSTAKIQLASIQWANDAEYRDRKTSEMRRKTMKAYGSKGDLLDLNALGLGRGSIIQAVVQPGLFVSALVKQPQPSFKLQGVRVLKLVQFQGGGGGGSLGEVSEEDLALAGNLDVDDLSEYAKGANDASERASPAKASPRRPAPQDDWSSDLDDEIPF